jgi:hypothetical protein
LRLNEALDPRFGRSIFSTDILVGLLLALSLDVALVTSLILSIAILSCPPFLHDVLACLCFTNKQYIHTEVHKESPSKEEKFNFN